MLLALLIYILRLDNSSIIWYENEEEKKHYGVKRFVKTNDSFKLHLILNCDMIKRNESDVGNVVLEILAKTMFKFLCFILFLALSKSFITL